MPEWAIIAEELGNFFAEHTKSAVSEEQDISIVRYHKGWIDAINEFIDMLERLFPEPNEKKELDESELAGDSIITRRTDGSVY